MLYLPCCLLLSITLHEELQIWNFSSMSNLELGITNQSAAYNKVSITIMELPERYLAHVHARAARSATRPAIAGSSSADRVGRGTAFVDCCALLQVTSNEYVRRAFVKNQFSGVK